MRAMPSSDRVRNAERAAYVAAGAGLVALVAIVLFLATGQPFGTINDAALLVMTLAIAPIMLGSYELGGVTLLWPARISLAGGIGACLAWSLAEAAILLGIVPVDVHAPASGWFAVQAIALLVIGAWLIGAPLLAGPWLPRELRWLGALAGVGFVLYAIGLLAGGFDHPLTDVGGVGYQVVFPIWAYLLARLLGGIGRA